MTSNWKISLTGFFLLVVFGYTGYLRHQVSEAREAEQNAYLQLDSIQAVTDTTREIKNLLADSVRYFERRVVQTELEKDSLDKALDRESRARASFETKVDSLQRVVQSDSTQEDSVGVRTTAFHFYDEPYTVDAEIVIPPPPTPADMDIGIKLDPISLSVRIGCSPTENTIQSATLGVTAPRWAEIDITEVQEEPGVCNPRVDQPDMNWFQKNRGKIGLTVGSVTTVLLYLLN